MAWFNRLKKSSIGIDIGGKYLRAMQLQHVDNAWRIEAATVIPRSASGSSIDQDEVSRFAAILDRQGFTGRDAVVAIPEDVLLGGILKLPSRKSGAPLDQIAKMETARIHRCAPESFEMAAWDLPTAGLATDTTQVMVAACSHEESDRLLDVFEVAKLNIVALDTSAWSIARACAPLITTAPNVTAILDLGWALSRLVVLCDGVIIYERAIPEAGIKLLSETLVKRTGMGVEMVDLLLLDNVPDQSEDRKEATPDYSASLRIAVTAHVDTMVEEVKQSFSYALHRYPGVVDQQLLLVGGGASIPGMCQCIADVIDMPMRQVNVSSLAQCPHDLTQSCDSPAFVKALGLAMHGMAPIV